MINVIMLHDIREKKLNFFFNRYKLPYFLEPKQFCNILDNINRSGHNIINPESFILGDYSSMRHDFVMTFDDGLKDHLYAARKLNHLKLKGFFFLPVNPIINKKVLNVHKIQFLLSEVDLNTIIKEIKKHYSEYTNIDSANLDCFYESKWKNNIWPKEMVFITRVLREADTKKWRDKIVDFLFSKYITSIQEDLCEEFYLSNSDVEEIIQMGHHIGGHGYHSVDLSFEDISSVKEEIQKCKNFLSKINCSHRIFSYPNGGYNDSAINELKNNGFLMSFTTKQQLFCNFDKLFEIPRIDPSKTDLIN